VIWPLLSNLERLKHPMKSGLGCPYHDLGADHAHGEMRFSAPWMQNNLIQNILPGLDGVVERLRAGADVVDVGCWLTQVNHSENLSRLVGRTRALLPSITSTYLA
jgi:hypothetical protein